MDAQQPKSGDRTHEGQRSSRILRWNTIDQHICLRGNNSGVDESKEEETTDKRTDGIIGGVWVFSLLLINPK